MGRMEMEVKGSFGLFVFMLGFNDSDCKEG